MAERETGRREKMVRGAVERMLADREEAVARVAEIDRRLAALNEILDAQSEMTGA